MDTSNKRTRPTTFFEELFENSSSDDSEGDELPIRFGSDQTNNFNLPGGVGLGLQRYRAGMLANAKKVFRSTRKRRSSRYSPKSKKITDLFPWISNVIQTNLQLLGYVTELKNTVVLDAMDYLLKTLSEDTHDYYKSPKLAVTLSKYVRQCLYTYRYMYRNFIAGKDYLRRLTKVLAIYTDLELCSSVLGLELDHEAASRILFIYRYCLGCNEEIIVMDIFLCMKRLCRGHRGIINLLLQHYLNKITILEPVELHDELFIKHLVIYKKWLNVEEVFEEKLIIREAFITHVKPKKTLCMNATYAPYLPADEEGSPTIDNYIRMLDKKYSLEPLISALELSERISVSYEEFPNGFYHEITEVVILSDDEDQTSDVKIEQKSNQTAANTTTETMTRQSGLIDLTDEIYDESKLCRHYVAWLSELVARAKMKPITVDQRLGVATISDDVIVIDDDESNGDSTENVPQVSTDMEIAVTSEVNNIESPCSDSGCVSMNREEVGIHSNHNFDMSQSSPDTGFKEGEVVQDAVLCDKVVDDSVISNNTTTNNNFVPEHVTTGSISSCSELAAEQLLTVSSIERTSNTIATENQLENTSNIEESITPGNITIINNTEVSNSQKEIASHISNEEKPSNTITIRQDSLLRKSNDEDNRLVDNTGNVTQMESEHTSNLDENDETFLSNIFSISPIRANEKELPGTTINEGPTIETANPIQLSTISTNSNACPSIETANPIQPSTSSTNSNASPAHSLSSDWFRDKNDVVSDLENSNRYSQKRIHSPVPTSFMRQSNALLRSPYWNESSRRLEHINRAFDQELGAEETVEYDDGEQEGELRRQTETGQSILKKYIGSGNYGDSVKFKLPKNTSKSSPVPQHERSVRFADDVVQDTPSNVDNVSPSSNTKRRPPSKIDVPNLDEGVPSTIKDRKTYIKSAGSSASRKYAKIYTSSRTILPTARSPPPASYTQSQHSHISPNSPSNTSAGTSDSSPRTPTGHQYRIYYSADKIGRQTPYDQRRMAAGLGPSFIPYSNYSLIKQSPNMHPISSPLTMLDTYQKIDGCFINCSLLDEKIFSAVVELEDIRASGTAISPAAKPQPVSTGKPTMVSPIRPSASVMSAILPTPNMTLVQSTSNTSKSKQKSDFDKYLLRKRNEFDKYLERRKQRQTKRQRDDRQAQRSEMVVTPTSNSNRYEIYTDGESEAENSMPEMSNSKPTRKQHKRNINEVNLMVQLQRERSLRIFNNYDNDYETILSKNNSNAVSSNGKLDFRQNNSFNGNMSINETHEFIDRGVETDTDTYLRRENQNRTNQTMIRGNRGDVQFRTYRKPRRRKVYTDIGIESEPEHSFYSTKRLQELRRYDTTDIDTESEDLVSNTRRSLRNLRKSKATENENELEIKKRKLNETNRNRYQKEGEFSFNLDDLHSTTNVNGRKGRRNLKSTRARANENLVSLLTFNPKLSRYLNDDKLTQVPIVKLYDLANNQSVLNTHDILPCIAPLDNLPNINSVKYNESFVGKTKSDMELQVPKTKQLYTEAARLLRRYSCFAGTNAPLDLSYQVVTRSDNYAKLCARFRGNRSNNNNRPTKGKRGRPSKKNLVDKRRINLTRQLLDSDEFSCILDIAKLKINSDEVDNVSLGDDCISIYDDIDSIDAQEEFYLKHPRLTVISSLLKTFDNPSSAKDSNNIIMDLTADSSSSNQENENYFNTIKSNASNSSPNVEVININSSSENSKTNPVLNSQNQTNASQLLPTPKENATDVPEKKFDVRQLDLPQAEKITKPSGLTVNTTENKTTVDIVNNGDHNLEPIAENIVANRIDIVLQTSKHLIDNCDDDDIDSPAYEPHVSESQSQVNESDEPIVRKRLGIRLKRSRGRPRWSRPLRQMPSIQPDISKANKLANSSELIPEGSTTEASTTNGVLDDKMSEQQTIEYPPPSPPLTTPNPQPPPLPPPRPVQQEETEQNQSDPTKEINDHTLNAAEEQVSVELPNGSSDINNSDRIEPKAETKEVVSINNGQAQRNETSTTSSLPPKIMVSLKLTKGLRKLQTYRMIRKRRIEQRKTAVSAKRGKRIIRGKAPRIRIIRKPTIIPTDTKEPESGSTILCT